MEKISRGKNFKYPIARFVKEDFIDIINIFSENCKRNEFVIEDYKLNSIGDIDELPYKEAIDFKLTGYEPYITLQGYYSFTQLYLSDIDSVVQQGIKSKIDGIFNKNKSIWSYFEIFFINVIILLLAMGGILIGFSIHNIIVIFCGILLILLWTYSAYISLKKHVVFYPKRSINRISFWEKNSDLIIVTIIATFIASLLVGLILKII